MTVHEVSIDLTVDADTGDNAYKAFCECGWADPQGWHHSDQQPGWDRHDPLSDDVARDEAHAAAQNPAIDHLLSVAREPVADEAEPAPDTGRFQALPIPTTDQNGYAR